MPFAAELRESLQIRKSQLADEFINGDDLEQVLSRQLSTVEAMADGELITSILLLSHDGKCLSHGAAPGLPQSYCEAIDGSEIGPCAGSCGTAAYLGRPIYVSDILTDPLWSNYRHHALPHGLRSCWSTPIRDPGGAIVGTFAIYRRTVGHPTSDEIDAIRMITEHCAQAIMLARNVQDLEQPRHGPPRLRLVANSASGSAHVADRRSRLASLVARLQRKTAELDQMAGRAESKESAEALRTAAGLSNKLVALLQRQIEDMPPNPAA